MEELPHSDKASDDQAIMYGADTDMYDGWMGEGRVLPPTSTFNLNLDTDDVGGAIGPHSPRFEDMLAAQAGHKMRDSGGVVDEEAILANAALTESQRREELHKCLLNAASNGDSQLVRRLVSGNARQYLDLNGPDDEGAAPIIYASCFVDGPVCVVDYQGHEDVVVALLEAGAEIDRQDKNLWTPLMWAMSNKHQAIVKLLLDKGASKDIKSTSGRTAFDFAPPDGEMAAFLSQHGFQRNDLGLGEDFYDNGLSQDRFEQELEENEMRRRMMMESSINLEVDLSSLGMDEHESPEETDDQPDFVWDRCLNDQMFVFQESELDRLLDIIITSMTPQRSPSQKPVPANVLFLAARYAHYHGSSELLNRLLLSATDTINRKVEQHQWDMTILAFWISNATLLLHYLKKDSGLANATTDFQVHLIESINDIYVFIIRDAERRLDRVLKAALLDHETIPFDHVEFAGEWSLFRSTKPRSSQVEPVGVHQKPVASLTPSHVTSLLSSTLFVLDLYDIHSVITAQVLSQLFYWIDAELFNYVISNKIYLARTKAMQIRMNVSVLEDWARVNNRMPEHYENGSLSTSGESTMETARIHLTPVVQLLQWLQCFSSLNYEQDGLDNTMKQLPRLSGHQLLHSVNHYRYEKEEQTMPKVARKKLQTLQEEPAAKSASESVLINPAHMLPFSLPTDVDLRLSYGAGYGGVNREREKRYIPSVPPDFLAKLDMAR